MTQDFQTVPDSSSEPFLPLLAASFELHSGRTAVVFSGESTSYGRLARIAAGAGAQLRSRGVERGDRVALYLSDKPAFLRAHLGALWIGAVPLPLNPRFTVPELSYYLSDSGARALVIDDESQTRAESAVQHSAAEGDARANPVKAVDLLAVETLCSAAEKDEAPADVKAGDPALLLYSSGTTGEPKGVVHTQANLAAAVSSLARCWRFSSDDVLVNVLPFFHIHGLSFATHVAWLSGATMLVGPAFHPLHTLDLVDRATVFMGVPPYYYSWLDRPEFAERAAGWSKLRLATCGSAPIRPDVLPRLQEILGRPVINRYGMTESHVITSLPLEGPTPNGSVGVPLEGVEVRVVADDGSLCSRDQVGAVHVRGPNLFREYWSRPEATREAFAKDGWFDTGDLGAWKDHGGEEAVRRAGPKPSKVLGGVEANPTPPASSQGFLTLVGRSKDLILAGGFNVYPAVVERALVECPGVREAAVFGLPDRRRGERVAAAVVPQSGSLDERQVKDFCRDRLVDYQCPASVFLVESLPRNTMGKVLRRALRERFSQ